MMNQINNQPGANQPGHWVLAKVGKRVLRPGGKELTMKLMEHLSISSNDDVVEFAPGLGFTAALALARKPKSYTGVELSEETAHFLRNKISGEAQRIIVGNAADSTLPENSADKVYAEAMLTMQTDKQKAAIVAEAYRILKSGGRYGIHELSLKPDDIDENTKSQIQRDLARVIKVNARPLTSTEWGTVLEDKGFAVKHIETNPMHLLEPKRMIDDEGLWRTLRIVFNILQDGGARKRILAMRETFRKYQAHLGAIAIVAEK